MCTETVPYLCGYAITIGFSALVITTVAIDGPPSDIFVDGGFPGFQHSARSGRPSPPCKASDSEPRSACTGPSSSFPTTPRSPPPAVSEQPVPHRKRVRPGHHRSTATRCRNTAGWPRRTGPPCQTTDGTACERSVVPASYDRAYVLSKDDATTKAPEHLKMARSRMEREHILF